jgi:RNA recognition motif-containing protein
LYFPLGYWYFKVKKKNILYIYNKAHFDKWGSITDVYIPKFADTGKSRGFAFVTFDSIEDADRAIGGTHTLNGCTLRLSPAVLEANGGFENEPIENEPTKRLYVGDLKTSTTEVHLRETFEKFGPLEVCLPYPFLDKNTFSMNYCLNLESFSFLFLYSYIYTYIQSK